MALSGPADDDVECLLVEIKRTSEGADAERAGPSNL
jgi:hypothetical protein